LLLLAWVAFSMVGSLWHWMSSGHGAYARTQDHTKLEEILVENNNSAHKIALIEVEGLITGMLIDGGSLDMVTLIEEQLKAAEADPDVKAVLLKVDSPGGEVLAADAIYRALQAFQKKSRKPVIASMGGVAASGGYYVSAPCQWIVANELTITGSIGVIMHTYNYRALMDKVGVRPVVYKSGRFKDMLSGDKSDPEILPEEGEMIKALIMQTFDRFKAIVAEGRLRASQENKGQGRTLAADWESLADGRILTGKDAYQKGFVDELGDYKQAVKRVLSIAQISSANIIRYQAPLDLSSFLRWFVKTDLKKVKLDLGLDLPLIRNGRLYYLAPALVP
jgi:protease IV